MSFDRDMISMIFILCRKQLITINLNNLHLHVVSNNYLLSSEGSAMGERVEPVVPGPDLVGVGVDRPAPLQHQQSTVWAKRQQAVCVRHAFKHYGSKKNPNHVLSNLNMTVAKGTM